MFEIRRGKPQALDHRAHFFHGQDVAEIPVDLEGVEPSTACLQGKGAFPMHKPVVLSVPHEDESVDVHYPVRRVPCTPFPGGRYRERHGPKAEEVMKDLFVTPSTHGG